MRKRLWLALIAMMALCLPAWSQYGGGMGGGGLPDPGGAPPPPAPPGSVGNPPPKMAPPKYFDGAIREIAGNVITVEQKVRIPGEPDQVVDMKFTLAENLQYEPATYKVKEKDSVRIIYEPKTIDGQDVRVATKVIRQSGQ